MNKKIQTLYYNITANKIIYRLPIQNSIIILKYFFSIIIHFNDRHMQYRKIYKTIDIILPIL